MAGRKCICFECAKESVRPIVLCAPTEEREEDFLSSFTPFAGQSRPLQALIHSSNSEAMFPLFL